MRPSLRQFGRLASLRLVLRMVLRLVLSLVGSLGSAMGLSLGLSLGAAASDASAPSGQSSVRSSAATAQLVVASYRLTPYLSADGQHLVVHVLPMRAGSEEQIVDARTGQRWAGTPAQVMATFNRLGTETPQDAARGSAFDQQMMKLLGCVPPVAFCTSPADADQMLLMNLSSDGVLRMQVRDLRGLLQAMDRLMAGLGSAQSSGLDAKDWQLLQWASYDPARRQRWLDALRSVDSVANWEAVVQTAQSGPELLRWPKMQPLADASASLDLRAELELLALRLNVSLLAQAASRGNDPALLPSLADALLLGSQVGFRGDVASHLVQELMAREPAQQRLLAQGLADQAQRRREHTLWCYAAWMSRQSCGGRPPWADPPSPAAADAAPAADAPDAAAPVRPARAEPAAQPAPRPAAQPATEPAVKPATRVALTPGALAEALSTTGNATVGTTVSAALTGAGDAQQEWLRVQGQANQPMLLAYAETSGHMAPEQGAVAGLSFVARSLGPLQEGRFEVQIRPSSNAPLQLRFGSYRVRVRLVLDYTREDRCRLDLLCLFSANPRHARTERRDLVYLLTPGNSHTARQGADFGSLVPLAADGNPRYASTLKEARLAVDSVRFELQ